MATVDIRNVEKRYGDVHIIKHASIPIADGEFVVLVGPSGCGKSTLLRMICGLEDISAGEISIDGRVVNSLPAKDRDIAMVFQNYALYPHMTVGQNMAFSMKMKGVAKAEIKVAVDRAADILGLQPYLDRYPRQLSGGQRQRVAMGRALVRNPKVFLFDEPLSNLDAKLRVQMRAEIRALHRRLKTTTVYVTHDQIEAMTMADKIVVMQDGIVEQMGRPLDLYDRPVNMFVAGFLGSPTMNFVHGLLPAGAGDYFEAGNGTRLPLARTQTQPEALEAVYGIRPEHVEIRETGIATIVQAVEPTGAEIHLILDLAGQPIVCVSRGRPDLKVGDSVHVGWACEQVHLFDRASGARLQM